MINASSLGQAHMLAAAFVVSRVPALLTDDDRTILTELRARHAPGERTIYAPNRSFPPDASLVARIDELLAP